VFRSRSSVRIFSGYLLARFVLSAHHLPERSAPSKGKEERAVHGQGLFRRKRNSRGISRRLICGRLRNTIHRSLSGPDRSNDLNITDEAGRCSRDHLGSPPGRSLLPHDCRRLSSRYATLLAPSEVLKRPRPRLVLSPITRCELRNNAGTENFPDN